MGFVANERKRWPLPKVIEEVIEVLWHSL
jgi:hypothetical protein